MDALAFLKTVLPDEGLYCLAQPGQRGFRHVFAQNVEALAAQAAQATGDVYFSIASFVEPRRRQASARSLKTFILDVDVGKPGGYATKHDALAALLKAVDDQLLPLPTIIVDSGGGLHVYWVLDRELPVAVWQAKARAFKRHLQQTDPQLAVDTARVADAAGVLRVPGTQNVKRGRLVQVLLYTGCLHSPDDFSEAAAGAAPFELSRPAYIQGDYDDALTIRAEDDPPLEALHAACPQFRQAFEQQAGESYDAWWCTVQLCAFTQEGRPAAHVMSCRYPGYTAEETDRKFSEAERSRAAGINPVTCERYAAARGSDELCRQCPYRGVTTPIVAARQAAKQATPVTPTPAPTPAPEARSQVEETIDPHALVKDLSRFGGCNFVFDEVSGEVRLIYDTPGDTPVINLQASPRLMFVREIIDGDDPAALVALLDREGRRVVAERPVPLRIFGKSQTISTLFETFGYTLPRGSQHERAYKAFTGAIAVQANSLHTRRRSTNRMGWFGQGFVLGRTLVTAKGEKEIVVPPDLSNIADLFVAKGDAQVQLAATQRMLDIMTPEARLALLASLASPLMAFTGVNGLFLHLQGPSGTGKSTLLQLGSSLWGQPIAAHFTPYDTVAAREARLFAYHNLPAHIDEITPLLSDPEMTQKFIYAVTNGEGYHRARRDGSLQRAKSGWRLISITTANRSLRSACQRQGGTEVDEALLLRVMEMRIEHSTLQNGRLREAQEILATLDDNYGHVGRMFIRHVLQRLDDVQRRVRQYTKEANLNFSQQYRFINAGLACIMVAGEILNEMGVRVDMDLIRHIGDKLRKDAHDARRRLREEHSAPKRAQAVVAHFLPRSSVFARDSGGLTMGTTLDGWTLQSFSRGLGPLPEARLLLAKGWARLIIPTHHLKEFVVRNLRSDLLTFLAELREAGLLDTSFGGERFMLDYLEGVPDANGNVVNRPPQECVAIIIQ